MPPPKTRQSSRQNKRKVDAASLQTTPSKKKREKKTSSKNSIRKTVAQKSTSRETRATARSASPTQTTRETRSSQRNTASSQLPTAPLPAPPTLPPQTNETFDSTNATPLGDDKITVSPKSAFFIPPAHVATAPPLVQDDSSWTGYVLLYGFYALVILFLFSSIGLSIWSWLWVHSKINHRMLMWVYIIYSTYNNIPHWVSFVKKKRKHRRRNDDLADPFAIVRKLNELQALVASKNQEIRVDLPWYKLNACFFSMFHLSAEIRRNHPRHRDLQYERSGPSLPRSEIEYLRGMLDFADWAYLSEYNELLENLASRGYQLLRHDRATEPGQVGHFIALNHKDRICMIGLKGTSTFSDLLTDIVGTIVPQELDAPFAQGDSCNIICHEGIFTAASVVADDLQQFLEQMVIPQGYRIVCIGHSLGAGTACLLGLLLRSRIPHLQNPHKNRRELPLEVIAFATPAVLNYTACVACAPFTTSVVNNSDMVPRLSVSNLLTMNQGLLEINRRLDERGLSPNSFRKFYRYARDITRLDDETLMSIDEYNDLFQSIHDSDSLYDDHDLYVPGRVVAMFERGEGREIRKEQGLEAAVGAVVADGSMKRLRMVELTTTMVRDHFCTSYANNLDDLLRDME